MKNLQLLQDLCGDQLNNVLLVTTFWDMIVPKGTGDKREAELANNYWRPLIDLGSRMHRYHRQKSSGEDLIQDILEHQSNVIELRLQIELAQAERTLLDTRAGKRVQEGLNLQLEQLGMTLNQVQDEQRAIDGKRNTGRSEKARIDAHKNRILEEIATVEHDLEILGMPRDIAMQEIDEEVAEIVNEKGIDEMDAFWDLFEGDEDDNSMVESPRPSLGMSRGQPTSPTYKPTGYGEQQFGRRNTGAYSQQKPTSSPGAYNTTREDRKGIFVGHDNRPHINDEYSPEVQGGQQIYSEPDVQAFEGLSISTKPQFGRYDDQRESQRSNFRGYEQPQQGGENDSDEYGNSRRRNTGGYGSQYGKGSRR